MDACPCGTTAGVRLYACGYRCPAHTPAALAGHPEPAAGRYCAPARCYCGTCPTWTPQPAYPVTPTIIDTRAIATGKRRAPPAGYREAQAAIHQLHPKGTP